jgi:hypothetical protein
MAEPARSADQNRQNNAPGQPESAQKQLTAKFDLVWSKNSIALKTRDIFRLVSDATPTLRGDFCVM